MGWLRWRQLPPVHGQIRPRLDRAMEQTGNWREKAMPGRIRMGAARTHRRRRLCVPARRPRSTTRCRVTTVGAAMRSVEALQRQAYARDSARTTTVNDAASYEARMHSACLYEVWYLHCCSRCAGRGDKPQLVSYFPTYLACRCDWLPNRCIHPRWTEASFGARLDSRTISRARRDAAWPSAEAEVA